MIIMNHSSWNNPLSTDGSIFYLFIGMFVIIGLLAYIVYRLGQQSNDKTSKKP